MDKENRVDEFDIIQEISKKSKQTQDVVRGTIHAYHTIIMRELQANKIVCCRNFVTYKATYRKSGLINPQGVAIVGGNALKVTPSRAMRTAINSKEPIDYSLDLFETEESKVIAKLKDELRKLKISNYHALNKADVVKNKFSDRIQRVYKRKSAVRVKKYTKTIANSRVNHKANILLNNKILRERINESYFLDAITAYPVLTKFYKSQQLTINELNMFIVINHFKYFTHKDAVLFGFNKNTAASCLSVLTDAKLIEKFEGRINTFCVSLIGKKKFTEFSREINKDMRLLLKEYNKKVEEQEKSLPVKFKF